MISLRKAVAALIISLFLLASAIAGNSPSSSPKLFSSAPLGSTDYPWTMFHHDSLRLGASPASAPATGSLMWNYPTGAQVYASPAVNNGIVFIPSWDGVLYAIDEYSGALKWSFNTGASIFSSPAIGNGIVYVGSYNGVLYALDEQTGATIWSKGIVNYPITSSPLVADGMVFYGNWCRAGLCNPAGQFTARDANTGNVIWVNSTQAPVISSPSVHNGRVFFGQNDGTLMAVNETNGVLLWSVAPSNVVVRTAPAVAYGRVYVGTDSRFLALNELTGTTAWTFNDANNNATSGAVNNGAVFFGTGRGNVYALNATTGAQIWSSPTGAAVSSSPALALGSNMLLVGSNDRYLYALSMTTGVRLWRYLTGAAIWSSPAVADGRVFFGSQDNNVYALGARLPSLQVSILPSVVSLKPGEVSNLTVTVTNGTSRVSGVTLVFSSSAGGGFSPATEKSLGIYLSNYTAPLVSSVTTTTIQVTASKTGYLDGSATTTISLNPFPPLKVYVTPRPASISPGGDILLLILVVNETQPVAGASIFLTSTGGGSFSSPTYAGGGNYTAIYSAGLQSSSPTVVVQASKQGFSPGTAQVTISIGGVPDLLGVKLFGLPLLLIVAALFFLIFVVFVALLTRREKRDTDLGPRYHPDALNYCLGFSCREGLSNRFWAGLSMGLAAIAGS